MASQSAQQLQQFFNETGSESIAAINLDSIQQFVQAHEDTFRPVTMLIYIRTIVRFMDWAFQNRLMTFDRHRRSTRAVRNVCLALQRKIKRTRAEEQVEKCRNRLPPEARSFYFNSRFVQKIRAMLAKPDASCEYLLNLRNYIMTALTLWNGNRPMVLRELTFDDIKSASRQVVDGVEYMVIQVGKHKTAGTYGASMLSLPVDMHREVVNFSDLVQRTFQVGSGRVFRTREGVELNSSSTVNRMIQCSWRRSGAEEKFPQRFNATETRRLMTTETRSMDPDAYALVAAQLGHSVSQADKAYALQRRSKLSCAAVHKIDKALRLTEKDREAETYPLQPLCDRMNRTPKDRADDTESGPSATEQGPRGTSQDNPADDSTDEGEQAMIRFPLLPNSSAAFRKELLDAIAELPWGDIQWKANYWMYNRSCEEFSQESSVVDVAEAFSNEVYKRHGINVISELLALGVVPRGDGNVELLMMIIAASKIGDYLSAFFPPS